MDTVSRLHSTIGVYMNRSYLFILKKRQSPSFEGPNGYSSSPGLNNSAKFVVDMLNKLNIKATLVEVVDNNDIDREVTKHKPTYVVIEALWVVPDKFKVLTKLHPTVRWIVRVHSEIPFLSNEGIAMEWINGYLEYPQVSVAFNSKETYEDFQNLHRSRTGKISTQIEYLPNYYPVDDKPPEIKVGYSDNYLSVGCFGAIRPLKNHLIQVFAAIEYARKYNKILLFHINSTRIEGRGDSILKNIRSIFAKLPDDQFRLIEHSWMPHDKFKQLIDRMDIVLQVSFSETFNIVAADAVSSRVPVVVSNEIGWVSSLFYAEETSVDSIVSAMRRAILYKKTIGLLFDINLHKLKKFSGVSASVWRLFTNYNETK